MSMDFDMNDSGAQDFIGYFKGVSAEIKTPEYIGSIMTFTRRTMSDAFGRAMDTAAFAAKKTYSHVYEWGNTYGDESTVGVPKFRLWELVSTGRGGKRYLTFIFKPSLRPTPIHEALLEPNERTGKAVIADVHVFTWKAPMMEYGQKVKIAPLEEGGWLAFFSTEKNQPMFTQETINTTVGTKHNKKMFTTFWLGWWNADAPATFRSEVLPVLEANAIPRYKQRKVPVRRKSVGIDFASSRKAELRARSDMRRRATDFSRRARIKKAGMADGD